MPLIANRQIVRKILDTRATGVAVWHVQPFFCVLNQSAVQLTGFSDRDFQQNKSPQLNRVDPQDQALISAAWKKLWTEKTKVTCDCRFLPNVGTEQIWIRDVSVPFHDSNGKYSGIISVYTDVSGMESTQIRNDLGEVIERLAHDVRNCVHVIGGGAAAAA